MTKFNLFYDFLILISLIPVFLFSMKLVFSKKIEIVSVMYISMPAILILLKWNIDNIITVNNLEIEILNFIFSIVLNFSLILYLGVKSLNYTVFNIDKHLFRNKLKDYLDGNNIRYNDDGKNIRFKEKSKNVKIKFNEFIDTMSINRSSYLILTKTFFENVYDVKVKRFNYLGFILLMSIIILFIYNVYEIYLNLFLFNEI